MKMARIENLFEANRVARWHRRATAENVSAPFENSAQWFWDGCYANWYNNCSPENRRSSFSYVRHAKKALTRIDRRFQSRISGPCHSFG